MDGKIRPLAHSYWLTRIAFIRLLGTVYLVTFLSLFHQLAPLFGENGFLPAGIYLERMEILHGGAGTAFLENPSVFWISHRDGFMVLFCTIGIALALIPMARYANAYPDGPSLGSLHVLLPDRVRFTALDGS